MRKILFVLLAAAFLAVSAGTGRWFAGVAWAQQGTAPPAGQQTDLTDAYNNITQNCLPCAFAGYLYQYGNQVANGLSNTVGGQTATTFVALLVFLLWLYRLGYMFITGTPVWREMAKEAFVLLMVALIFASGAYSFFTEWIWNPVMTAASGVAQAAYGAVGAGLGNGQCSAAGDVTNPALQGLMCVLAAGDNIIAAGLMFGEAAFNSAHLGWAFWEDAAVLASMLAGLVLMAVFGVLLLMLVFTAVEIIWDLVIGIALWPIALMGWPFPIARRPAAAGLRMVLHGIAHMILLSIGLAIAAAIMGTALSNALGANGIEVTIEDGNFSAVASALQQANLQSATISALNAGFWWALGGAMVIWLALKHSRQGASHFSEIAATGIGAAAGVMAARVATAAANPAGRLIGAAANAAGGAARGAGGAIERVRGRF